MPAATTLLSPKKKATTPRYISIEEYFRAEEKSLHKKEYDDGIIVKRAGTLLLHNRLYVKQLHY